MNSIKNGLVAGMVVLSALGSLPALADHHHHDDDYRYNNNWDRRDINHRVMDNNFDRHYYHQQAKWNNDWNSQRTMYRNNWSRISRERREELNEQMRAQWMAYHHNNWNGDYNWNMYNDPRFLDYMHTSNPGLLTTLRSYLGF
ncbi:MAG TPA: hypothetical protein V6C89_10405 [Drouetiella sp.]|jgi:hypothetical protein